MGWGIVPPLSSYSKMQHFSSSPDNLCAAITKSHLLVWGLLSQAALRWNHDRRRIQGKFDNKHSASPAHGSFQDGDAQSISSLDCFNVSVKVAAVIRAPDSIFQNSNQILWMGVCCQRARRVLKVRITQKCCRFSNYSKPWERVPSVWKAELILALSYANTKKQHLIFATSPPSNALVVTLPHRDFPMSRVGQEERVGGSACVGGSMKERLSSLIPRQAAREVLTN